MNDFVDYHNGPNLGLEPPAAPKAEPSDEEIEALALAHGINKSDEHWGARYYTELGSSLFRFARALLSRYGRPARDADEYQAMLAVMEQIDPATFPGLTAAQRCALGRFAKPLSALPQRSAGE